MLALTALVLVWSCHGGLGKPRHDGSLVRLGSRSRPEYSLVGCVDSVDGTGAYIAETPPPTPSQDCRLRITVPTDKVVRLMTYQLTKFCHYNTDVLLVSGESVVPWCSQQIFFLNPGVHEIVYTQAHRRIRLEFGAFFLNKAMGKCGAGEFLRFADCGDTFDLQRMGADLVFRNANASHDVNPVCEVMVHGWSTLIIEPDSKGAQCSYSLRLRQRDLVSSHYITSQQFCSDGRPRCVPLPHDLVQMSLFADSRVNLRFKLLNTPNATHAYCELS